MPLGELQAAINRVLPLEGKVHDWDVRLYDATISFSTSSSNRIEFRAHVRAKGRVASWIRKISVSGHASGALEFAYQPTEQLIVAVPKLESLNVNHINNYIDDFLRWLVNVALPGGFPIAVPPFVASIGGATRPVGIGLRGVAITSGAITIDADFVVI